jgi:Putative prokaryotic signal transducing protein
MGLRYWVSRLLRHREPDEVVVTVVPNEAIAGMVRSVLAAEGIKSAQKSATGGLPYGGVGGGRMILVAAADATRAKRLIDSIDPI